MEEVERRARLICGALHGFDSDTMVSRDTRRVVADLYVAPSPAEVMPLWQLYTPAARLLIADEERRAEEKQTIELGRGEKVVILADAEVTGFGRVMLRLWPDDLVLWVGGRIVATIMRGKS